jgi:hypothetical protein
MAYVLWVIGILALGGLVRMVLLAVLPGNPRIAGREGRPLVRKTELDILG